jgi:hypothetical protein
MCTTSLSLSLTLPTRYVSSCSEEVRLLLLCEVGAAHVLLACLLRPETVR